MNVAIITSAGTGERSGLKINKNLFTFDGSTVIEKTVSVFLSVEEIDRVIVTAPKNDLPAFVELFKNNDKVTVITGGDTRTGSVKNALSLIEDGYVLIHDGVRPFVTAELIKKCLYKAVIEGNCVPVTPVTDTLAITENDAIVKTERAKFSNVQTPQVFETNEIKKAYDSIAEGEVFTDDCGVYLKYIGKCHYVSGDTNNVKLTYKKDFENLLEIKNGIGFDLHKLVAGRDLVLGGVKIPHSKGLLGHSDADVVLHALMDAILSSCALKDIGNCFPDTDPQYKNISSAILLEKVLEIAKKQGYKPVNASIVIMAEKPKLSPFTDAIRQNIAKLLNVEIGNVGVSCTTLEGVGLVGREEAIACYATATVKSFL